MIRTLLRNKSSLGVRLVVIALLIGSLGAFFTHFLANASPQKRSRAIDCIVLYELGKERAIYDATNVQMPGPGDSGLWIAYVKYGKRYEYRGIPYRLEYGHD